jgi:hypothetical protein
MSYCFKMQKKSKSVKSIEGTPAIQHLAYGIPESQNCTDARTTQMVWGPVGCASVNVTYCVHCAHIKRNVAQVYT